MRARSRIAALVGALVLALSVAPLAARAGLTPAATVRVSPAAVKPGHKVRVYGSVACPAGDRVAVVSYAFKGARHRFHGTPELLTRVTQESTYSVTFRIRRSVAPAKYGITLLCHHGLYGGGSLRVL